MKQAPRTAEPAFEVLGEDCVRFRLPPSVDRPATLARLGALPGVVDVVFAEQHGAVYLERGAPRGEPLRRAVSGAFVPGGARAPSPVRSVSVTYDGPDLERVAGWAGLPVSEVVARHSGRIYTVSYLGFLPGFAYIGPLDPVIAAPRLPAPRSRVPAGSVAIAGTRTGIYPCDSPGGWNLLGRVIDLVPFDVHTGAALAPGDRVRFVPVGPTVGPTAGLAATPSPPPMDRGVGRLPALEIVAVAAPAWVQDGGRPGRMAQGVPPGGALVPAWLEDANDAVGNAAGEAGVEAFGELYVAARGADLHIAWAGEPALLPRDHVRRLRLDRGAPVAYLAVRGGVDVDVVVGGRGLLPVAGFGGGFGRPLRPGDRLPVGAAGAWTPAALAVGRNGPRAARTFDLSAALRVFPGPDLARFAPDAWHVLLHAEWRVGRGDRVGMRLAGPALPRSDGDEAVSAPMVRGAIQVPAGGGPVVLGPDHPTTGGYPVLGVVARADQGALAARAEGAIVRFRAGAADS